jgi:5-methylcytosine-specific restriction endonuclease McrA
MSTDYSVFVKKKSAKICENCGGSKAITREHRIPHWLMKRLVLLEIKIDTKTMQENIRSLCANCNMEKGGMIDYTDPLVRKIMRQIAVKIIENLKK